MKENEVKYVLNATREICNFYEEDNEHKVNYKRINVDDALDADLKKYFEESNDFIKNGKSYLLLYNLN